MKSLLFVEGNIFQPLCSTLRFYNKAHPVHEEFLEATLKFLLFGPDYCHSRIHRLYPNGIGIYEEIDAGVAGLK